MSSRNIRRLVAEREREERERTRDQENQDDDELDDEYCPHFMQMNPAFEGLEVSSDSDSHSSSLSDSESESDSDSDSLSELSVLSDQPYQDEAAAVIPEEDHGAKEKVYTNTEIENQNKKKQRKNNKKAHKKPDEMDEVEWSVQEVNRLLGEPPEKEEEVVVDKRALERKRIFYVHPNDININYELAKVFGDDTRIKKVRCSSRRMRHEIGLSLEVFPIQMKGLSMTLYKTEGDIKFFRFVHSKDYQTRCHALSEQLKTMLSSHLRHENNLHSENSVEALLENCDFLYYIEEHKAANEALERAIYHMQSAGEPSFNFVDGKTRIEYEFVENRPLLIAILKYIHVLTNIACHRTALELAKVLLNLDPSDPLGVVFIIDTLAIRARKHQWLLDLVEYWREDRQAHKLFHMRYSQALAMFHVACKKKDYDGIDAASFALMKAIKIFPPVAVKIIEYSHLPVPEDVRDHEIFVPPANIAVSKELNELMDLYAWLITPRWREPPVWKWFVDTLIDLCDEYDQYPEVKDDMFESAKMRAMVYRKIPTQIKRHLYVIRPMASYISEGRMPHTDTSVAYNPYPCEEPGNDTYNYFTDWLQQNVQPGNAFMALIQNIYPDLYQIGIRNMDEMLERMDGMEITVSHGSYLVVGPRLFHSAEEPEDENELRTYRVVFLRRPVPTVDGHWGPPVRDLDEVDPFEEVHQVVVNHGGLDVILHRLGIDYVDDNPPFINVRDLQHPRH